MLEHVGVRVPGAARPAFERFPGAHAVEQVIDDAPPRLATGWLEEGLAIGGEAGEHGFQARDQFHPATVHWRHPDGGVAWLRIQHHAATRATASERRLVVECDPHPARGPRPVRWITNTAPVEVDDRRWRLPGLAVAVTSDAALVDPTALEYRHDPSSRFELVFTPDP
jgi:hypothetical protein